MSKNVEGQLVGGELRIPAFDLKNGVDLPEPIVLRNSVLGQIVTEEEAESLYTIKIPAQFMQTDEDGTAEQKADRAAREAESHAKKLGKEFLFKSGDSFVFGSPELIPKIAQFFPVAEGRGTYGSLLSSDCYAQITTLEGVRVKVVDYTQSKENPDLTHDCFGWCSTRVAALLNNEGNRPFQFRMAYQFQEGEQPEPPSKKRSRRKAERLPLPATSFIAKGVLLAAHDSHLDGHDLIIDRSSIKGLPKGAELDQILPCGSYYLPEMTIGNRQNAKASPYRSCWEFSCWFSPEALSKDLGPKTAAEARTLLAMMDDPTKLKGLMIEKYRQTEEAWEDYVDPDITVEPKDHYWLQLLENDEFGTLLGSRRFAVKALEFVQSSWRDLATRGAVSFNSGMAVPLPGLPEGCVCIPHLEEGDIVMTRYPIVSKDNIRVAKNVHVSDWMGIKGMVGMHPDDAAVFQADYDGDQMVCIPADQIPNIAKECKRLEEPSEFKEIKKFAKQPYMEQVNADGTPRYKSLLHAAIASEQGRMALVSTWIGRVQGSRALPGEDIQQFEVQKRVLLEKLFQCMQVEVDAPKSAMRMEDLGDDFRGIFGEVYNWTEQRPSPFFTFYKDPNLYCSTVMIPTQTGGPLYVLPKIVNDHFRQVELYVPSRESVRYLAEKPDMDSPIYEYATQIKEEYDELIRSLTLDDKDTNRKEANCIIGSKYKSLRDEIAQLSPQEQKELANAIWYICHTPANSKEAKASVEAAKGALPYMTIEQLTIGDEVYPQPRYAIYVPFSEPAKEKDGSKRPDRASRLYDRLETEGIKAHVHTMPTEPVIKFVLDHPCPFIPDSMEDDNYVSLMHSATIDSVLNVEPHSFIQSLLKAHIHNVPEEYEKLSRYIAPHYNSWAVDPLASRADGALAYAILTDQVCEMLHQPPLEATIVGVDHNQLKQVSFEKVIGKTISCEVHRYDEARHSNPKDPDNYVPPSKRSEMVGRPVVMVGGKTLGVFAQGAAKLPLGSTFDVVLEEVRRREADNAVSTLRLAIVPDSIVVPQPVMVEPVMPEVTQPQRTKQQKAESELAIQLKEKLKQSRTRNASARNSSRKQQAGVGERD